MTAQIRHLPPMTDGLTRQRRMGVNPALKCALSRETEKMRSKTMGRDMVKWLFFTVFATLLKIIVIFRKKRLHFLEKSGKL